MSVESKKTASNCESCVFYDYDEDWEEYVCTVNLDQDELARFLSDRQFSCPYYRYYDEYKSVHKQIWRRKIEEKKEQNP